MTFQEYDVHKYKFAGHSRYKQILTNSLLAIKIEIIQNFLLMVFYEMQ